MHYLLFVIFSCSSDPGHHLCKRQVRCFHLRASSSFCNSSILLSFLSSSDFAVLYKIPIFFLRASFSACSVLICCCNFDVSGDEAVGFVDDDNNCCFPGTGLAAAAKCRSPYKSSSSFMGLSVAIVVYHPATKPLHSPLLARILIAPCSLTWLALCPTPPPPQHLSPIPPLPSSP